MLLKGVDLRREVGDERRGDRVILLVAQSEGVQLDELLPDVELHFFQHMKMKFLQTIPR